MRVIVPKESKSMRFRPHMNEALGKFYHTKEDYLSDMKKGGFEPYTGEAPKPRRETPDTRPTNAVLRAIKDSTNKDGSLSLSGNLQRELMARGVVMTKEQYHKQMDKVRGMTNGR